MTIRTVALLAFGMSIGNLLANFIDKAAFRSLEDRVAKIEGSQGGK